jgi:hypothetical protein
MLTVKGIYQDGKISLQQQVHYKTRVKVLVTFLDDRESVPTKQPGRKTFSFRQAREQLKQYKGSLSDAVIEERRQAL